MIDKNCYYTDQHEWARVEGEIATVGISDHAQELLGELTFVELPEVGMKVSAGDEIGSVESSKSASDIYSPVAGKVIEINDALSDKPELVNLNAYSDGWICKIEITDNSCVEKLMNADAYGKMLEGLE
jgi:glycine cleavage system H protein